MAGIDTFLAEQNKALEKQGLPKLIKASEKFVAPRVTSGILSLDTALGGGWMGNSWVEVYGESSSGKTSGILHTIATNQRLNPDFETFWLASEPYDVDWAEKNGIDNNRVTILETQHMEAGMQAVIDAASSKNYDCIVIDSYPALIANQEDEKGMDDAVVAAGARVVGKFFRKVGGTFNEDRPYLGFWVNQFREKIGGFSPYGTPKTLPGGKAKDFAFYQRVVVSRDDWIKEKVEGQGEIIVGQSIKFKVEKNKAGAPQKTAATDFYFEYSQKGFHPGEHDAVKDMITMGVMFKFITRAGAYYRFGEHQWQGRDGMVNGIREDLDIQDEIRKLVLDKVKNG
ncbi:RecA-like DNA recombinase [Streptomyces phage Alone3]|nr:RecA-like DNA recombinase [Streptomyces phage Alone3]